MRVPATSANLGPGFDALGLALDLHDEVTVRVRPGGLEVAVTGRGADRVPRDEGHLVVRAARRAFDALAGAQPPGLDVRCVNRIPHERGLGSSAAAIVSGMVAARALVPGGERILDDAALLALAAEVEGHPDNVAPCLLGGFTVAWTEGGRARAVSTSVAAGVRPVLFVPKDRSSTALSRGLLPDTVPHADAAHNAGRAALLTHAITVDPALLLSATEDRLHQRYRATAMPATAALVERLRGDGVPAVVSGAGPAVLAFADPGTDLSGRAPGGWDVVHSTVDATGATACVLDT